MPKKALAFVAGVLLVAAACIALEKATENSKVQADEAKAAEEQRFLDEQAKVRQDLADIGKRHTEDMRRMNGHD